MIKLLGIRSKLNLFTVLLVAAVSLFVALIVLYQNYQGRLENLHTRAIADATLLQRTLVDPLRLADDFMAYQFIAAAFASRNSGNNNPLEFILLLDDKGKILSSSSPELLPLNSMFEEKYRTFMQLEKLFSGLNSYTPPQLKTIADSREFYVLAPIGEYGVKYANLLLVYSLQPLIDNFISKTAEISFIILVISLVLMIFSQLILRRLMQPFKILNENMLAMSVRHNLNINTVEHSGDEVKILEDTFSQMETQLKVLEESRNQAEEELRNLNVELEMRVQQRTAEMEKAKDEAELANNAKSDFLSSMSHELRTPMNAILGFGQLLQLDEYLSENQKNNVDEIVSAGRHLLNLINEVLDLAKIESGHIDLSLEPVELHLVVEECMMLIGIMAEKNNINITQADLTDVWLRADRTRLKQILINLLSNAVKYNRDGGIVHFDVKRSGKDRLQILVSDTGKGISAEHLKTLFTPFNRLDAEKGNIEGTGIGLTITRRIVEMMDGSVDVISEEGVGSTFVVELPIEFMPVNEIRKISKTGTLEITREEHQLILYFEDNPANLKLMAHIVGRWKNIHLLTAHTPELGIELATVRQPDLILLDLNMDGMDGYQVLSVLKASEKLKDIPVIAVTANAMPRDLEKGIKAGFIDNLTKPIDVSHLYRILDKYLKS